MLPSRCQRKVAWRADRSKDRVTSYILRCMIKGIGIDSVQLSRIARVHAEYGQKFLARIVTDAEREYVAGWADPVPRIAGRFAAKEACMKALGTGWGAGVRWRDIEVRRGPAGAPVANL